MNVKNLAIGAVLALVLALGATFAVQDTRPSKGANRAKQQKRAKARKRAKIRSRAPKRTLEASLEPIRIGPERQAEVGDQPNIVVIIGCSLRRDQLGVYGGHAEASPWIDSAAASGTVFDGGISAAPWTRPASAALLTGKHPATIGMVEPGDGSSRRRLAAEEQTLAEALHEVGYITLGATANPNLNAVFGFDQGFDVYIEGTAPWRLGGRAKVGGREILTEALPQIAAIAKPDAPLYAQFLFTETHQPTRVGPAEITRFTATGIPNRLAGYRAMVRRFDTAVQVLEGSLAHQGITRENTVFVVVSDHGEGLGIPIWHGRGHGNFTSPSVVRMPWIVWGQGIPAGHRISGMASQIDVMPTIAALAGAPVPDGVGTSQLEALKGTVDTTGQQTAFVDTWFKASRRSAVYTPTLNCHEDWKRVLKGGRRIVPRVCFTRDDRREIDRGDGANAILATLDTFHAEMDRAARNYPHTADAEPPAEILQQLEALGYTEP